MHLNVQFICWTGIIFVASFTFIEFCVCVFFLFGVHFWHYMETRQSFQMRCLPQLSSSSFSAQFTSPSQTISSEMHVPSLQRNWPSSHGETGKKERKSSFPWFCQWGFCNRIYFFFLVPYARKKGIRINFHLCIKTFFLFKSDVNGNQVFKTTLSGSQMTAFMRVIFKWLCILLQCFLMTEIKTVYSSPIHYVL